jgi:hypothetical protein
LGTGAEAAAGAAPYARNAPYGKEEAMPKAAKTTAPESFSLEGFEGRYAELPGGYTVGFEAYSEDQDPAELFRGLPDDRCQSPHWGVVLRGRITFRYADGEETIEAGEAYYAPPGHTPVLHAGTELVEFSPTASIRETVAVVLENLRAAGVTVES